MLLILQKAFLHTALICSLMFKALSKTTPRFLTDGDTWMLATLMSAFMLYDTSYLLMTMISVLSSLSLRKLAVIQVLMSIMQFCILSMACCKSSGSWGWKWHTVGCPLHIDESLQMFLKKPIGVDYFLTFFGPITDPWVTPHSSPLGADTVPLIPTDCVPQSHMISSMLGLHPWGHIYAYSRLLIRIWWSMVSKAADKSKRMRRAAPSFGVNGNYLTKSHRIWPNLTISQHISTYLIESHQI